MPRGRRDAAEEGHQSPADQPVSAAIESTALANLAFTDSAGSLRCIGDRFHWNGSELVFCGDHNVAWAELTDAPVTVSIGPLEDGSHVEIAGTGVVDTVAGCAPEFRAAAVRYLGSREGNDLSDQIADTALTFRLFVSPVADALRRIDLRS